MPRDINLQTQKEDKIKQDFIAENAKKKYKHDYIMAELGKKYFLAPATIENIIYGRYERRRKSSSTSYTTKPIKTKQTQRSHSVCP